MIVKVYISGPMTGIDDMNYQAFNAASEGLKAMGFIPINPARHPSGLTYEQYMSYAMLDVEFSDCVVILAGWDDSPGAIREVEKAGSLGIPVKSLRQFIGENES